MIWLLCLLALASVAIVFQRITIEEWRLSCRRLEESRDFCRELAEIRRPIRVVRVLADSDEAAVAALLEDAR